MEGKTYTFDIKKIKQLPDDFIAVKIDKGIDESRYGLIDKQYVQLLLVSVSDMEIWRDLNKEPNTINHYEPDNNDINSKQWTHEFSESYSSKGPQTKGAFAKLLEIYREETSADNDVEQIDQNPYRYENNYVQQLYDQYYSTEPQPDPKKIFVVKDDMPETLQKRIKEIVAKLSLKTKTSKVNGNDVIIDDSNFSQYVNRYMELQRGANENTKIENIRFNSIFGKLTENLNKILVESMQEIKNIESAIDDAIEYRRLSPKNSQYWEQLQQYYTDVKKSTPQQSATPTQTPAPSGNTNARYVAIPPNVAADIGYGTVPMVKYYVDRKHIKPDSYYIVRGIIDPNYNLGSPSRHASENRPPDNRKEFWADSDWGKVDKFMKGLGLGKIESDNNGIFFTPGVAIPKPKLPSKPAAPPPKPAASAAALPKPQPLSKPAAFAPAKPSVPKLSVPQKISLPPPEAAPERTAAPKPTAPRVDRPTPSEIEMPDAEPKRVPLRISPAKQPETERPNARPRKQVVRPKSTYSTTDLYQPTLQVKPRIQAELPTVSKPASQTPPPNIPGLKSLQQRLAPSMPQSAIMPDTTDSILKPLLRYQYDQKEIVSPKVEPYDPPFQTPPTAKASSLPEPSASEDPLARFKTARPLTVTSPPSPQLDPLRLRPAAANPSSQRVIKGNPNSAPMPRTLEQRVIERVRRATKRLVSFQATAGEQLSQIARILKINIEDLKKLNPSYNSTNGGTVILPAQAARNADYTRSQIMIPDETVESLKQQARSTNMDVARRAKSALQELEKSRVVIEKQVLAKAVGSNLDQYASRTITIIDQTLSNEINDILRTAASTGDYMSANRYQSAANPNEYRRVIRNNLGPDAAELITDADVKKLESLKTAGDAELSPKQYKAIADKLNIPVGKLKSLAGKTFRAALGFWPTLIATELIFAQELGAGEDLELRYRDIDVLLKQLQNPNISKDKKLSLIQQSLQDYKWKNDQDVGGVEDPPQPIMRASEDGSIEVITPETAINLSAMDLFYGSYTKRDLSKLLDDINDWIKELDDMEFNSNARKRKNWSEDQVSKKRDEAYETLTRLEKLEELLPETRAEAYRKYFTNAVMLDWLEPAQTEESSNKQFKQIEVELQEKTVNDLTDAIEKSDIEKIIDNLGKRASEIVEKIPNATADVLQVDLRLDLGLKVFQAIKKTLQDLHTQEAETIKKLPDQSAKKQLSDIRNTIERNQLALSSVAQYSNDTNADLDITDQIGSISDQLLVPLGNNEYKFDEKLFPQYVEKLELHYGIPSGALTALSIIESSGGKKLYGDKAKGGSYGAFQVLSTDNGSFADYQKDTGINISKEELQADPILATEIGAWYFDKMLEQTTKEAGRKKWEETSTLTWTNGKTLDIGNAPANVVRAAIRHNGGPSAIDPESGEATKDSTYDYAKKYVKEFVKYYNREITESNKRNFKNKLQQRLFERIKRKNNEKLIRKN